MGKAISLSDDLMAAPPPVPLAARTPAEKTPAPKSTKAKPAEQVAKVPLQLNLPADEVKAIKRVALEADQTISDYLLAAFHAYKPAVK